jgi:type I restriction enzyme, S subunit
MNEKQKIDKLPKDWKWVKLGEVCEKVETVKRKEKKPEEELLYLDIGGIDNSSNKILSHKNYKWKDAPSRAQQIVFKDDVLFSTVRTYMKNIAIVENKIYDGQIASSGFCVIRGNKEIANPKFIFYYTVSQNFLRPLNELQTGSSYPAVRDKDVFIQPFPLPQKTIQLAIVSKIEELFSELDKGIEQLKTAQQQLKTYRQAVLKWAFEGKLTNDNVKDGELPEGWKWVKIEDATISLDNKRKPINKDERKKRHGNIPYYGANGQVGWIDDYIFDEPLVCVVEDETFTGREIPFSYKITGQTWVNNHAHVLKPNEGLNIDFLNYQLFYYPFLRLTTGTTGRKKLTKNALRNAPIKICSLEEQVEVVQEIESRLSVADKMEESITQSMQQAEALRQSILKKAFEGKLLESDVAESYANVATAAPHERKVLAGRIIYLMHDGHHFGLTKFQKVLYLIENFSQVDYETNYIQERAGPYDKKFTLAFRKEMQEKDWFIEEQKNIITKFVPSENAGSLIVDYAKYFRSRGSKITFVIRQLMDKSTHDAELIATLYAVWNNRLIKKKSVAVKHLVEDFFNWSLKKKEEFQEVEVVEMYKWMKKVKLSPVGFGKVIEPSNS